MGERLNKFLGGIVEIKSVGQFTLGGLNDATAPRQELSRVAGRVYGELRPKTYYTFRECEASFDLLLPYGVGAFIGIQHSLLDVSLPASFLDPEEVEEWRPVGDERLGKDLYLPRKRDKAGFANCAPADLSTILTFERCVGQLNLFYQQPLTERFK